MLPWSVTHRSSPATTGNINRPASHGAGIRGGPGNIIGFLLNSYKALICRSARNYCRIDIVVIIHLGATVAQAER